MLFNHLLTAIFMVVSSINAATTHNQDSWRGYSTNPQRFEYFGKNTPFKFVRDSIQHPISGNGTNVVLVYNNVAVTLYDIPVHRSLEVLNENLFKSLPHKVLRLEGNKPKVINLEY
ncbi:hypothetical protein CONCODRAFT_72113 [Conidiobolus coronatus NRRL 28638]|uniref:Uncharacterized protein n=1 Tax=Conidiobolus coronatus (strain ATCC 28846 / CBS 209.66 / NRRL 28638) TaxID=796925 RepID=A0A137P0M1_CONC2|nr:hypothetical protein CONCODRAFT_72113 [Conidiobolus coronatus NRRL 28638]|eukprot:KXN68633.1 hypothetical protein CONCODRAFT_72113 [Conidiobolus coronatus NRRL 28638]